MKHEVRTKVKQMEQMLQHRLYHPHDPFPLFFRIELSPRRDTADAFKSMNDLWRCYIDVFEFVRTVGSNNLRGKIYVLVAFNAEGLNEKGPDC